MDYTKSVTGLVELSEATKYVEPMKQLRPWKRLRGDRVGTHAPRSGA